MKKLIICIIFLSINVLPNELPELGSSFDTLINSADEKRIKFQIMQQVYSSNTVINDPEINDYLNNLGNELIENGTVEKPKINFFIVSDSSINAFAMLGNVIGVNTGLFFSANSESELASVLAHEIAHISQKHLLRLFDSQSRNVYKTYLALAIAVLAARTNPELASGALTAASASQRQDILNYTRSNEQEADRIGLSILEKSGYDPRGFINFFSTLNKFNNFSSGAAPAFLRTHPVTIDRISEIENRLKDLKYIQKINKPEFYFTKAKLRAFIGDYSNITNEFISEIENKRYVHKPSSFFGLVYTLLQQNKITEARRYFDELNLMKINSPMLIELNANLLIKEKKYEEAFIVYKKGIDLYPYYRAFIFGLSNLIIEAKKYDTAIDFLKGYISYYRDDPAIYEMIARAYSRKKNFQLEHENLGESFYHKYDLRNAISHMDIAVKINSDNFFDQSRVEHRLKELKREFELINN
jgi:predicted Zn-dependent protease